MATSRLLRTSAALLAAAALLSPAAPPGVRPAEASRAAARTGASAAPRRPRAAPVRRRPPPPYYEQKLTWRACGVRRLRVRHDEGAARLRQARTPGDIKLAVARKKATGPGKRLGSLLVNPGGPGGSAIGYLQQYAGIGYPAEVRARYDMVAVDPRGVARSEPVECLTGKQMDAYTQTDQTPDDRARDRRTRRRLQEVRGGLRDALRRSCSRHVSTVEAARDMDILRAALGDKKLTYVGRLVRHLPRGDVRRPLPRPRRPAGPGRRDGPARCPRAS